MQGLEGLELSFFGLLILFYLPFSLRPSIFESLNSVLARLLNNLSCLFLGFKESLDALSVLKGR